MCNVINLAKYTIGLLPVDNLKLQKLLYYFQGIHLARTDESIFEDSIEAWQYCPVVPNVYNKYKKFGFETIEEDGKNEENNKDIDIKEDERKTIDMVLEYYGSFSGLELVSRTHSESPWRDFYKPNQNVIIPVQAIKDYFKSAIEFEFYNYL